MLPHDLVSSLYNFPEIFHPLMTGVPGALEQYWAQNQDLCDSLGIGDVAAWLVIVSHIAGKCLATGPLEVFGDLPSTLISFAVDQRAKHFLPFSMTC